MKAWDTGSSTATPIVNRPKDKCGNGPGTTHHLGCQCHEARRDAEVQHLKVMLRKVVAVFEPYLSECGAEDDKRVTDALEEADELLREVEK